VKLLSRGTDQLVPGKYRPPLLNRRRADPALPGPGRSRTWVGSAAADSVTAPPANGAAAGMLRGDRRDVQETVPAPLILSTIPPGAGWMSTGTPTDLRLGTPTLGYVGWHRDELRRSTRDHEWPHWLQKTFGISALRR